MILPAMIKKCTDQVVLNIPIYTLQVTMESLAIQSVALVLTTKPVQSRQTSENTKCPN